MQGPDPFGAWLYALEFPPCRENHRLCAPCAHPPQAMLLALMGRQGDVHVDLQPAPSGRRRRGRSRSRSLERPPVQLRRNSRGRSPQRQSGPPNYRSKQSPVVCFRCKKAGHLHWQCPEKRGGRASALRCFKCGELGHKAEDCVQCTSCRGYGHKARDCPLNDRSPSLEAGYR